MRLLVALRCFWRALVDAAFAKKAEALLAGATDEAAWRVQAVRLLATLQREGRLVDFLMEDVEGVDDQQLGAGVRDVHRQSRAALLKCVDLGPVVPEDDNQPIAVPAGFDAGRIRLTGRVAGAAPYKGVVAHRGWSVQAVHLPEQAGAEAAVAKAGSADAGLVLMPAEVEIA